MQKEHFEQGKAELLAKASGDSGSSGQVVAKKMLAV